MAPRLVAGLEQSVSASLRTRSRSSSAKSRPQRDVREQRSASSNRASGTRRRTVETSHAVPACASRPGSRSRRRTRARRGRRRPRRACRRSSPRTAPGGGVGAAPARSRGSRRPAGRVHARRAAPHAVRSLSPRRAAARTASPARASAGGCGRGLRQERCCGQQGGRGERRGANDELGAHFVTSATASSFLPSGTTEISTRPAPRNLKAAACTSLGASAR